MRRMLQRGLLAVAVCVAVGVHAQDATWRVQEASLRFKATVSGKPDPKEAGCVAILPDGGLLPRPNADAVVIDDQTGKELLSEVVWHNPKEGLGVAFAEPEGSAVSIYIKSGQRPQNRKGDAPLKPGLLLYTQIGGATLGKAESMAGSHPPGREARMGLVQRIGHRDNPWGNDEDYASYYTGWLSIPKAGGYFFCTVSDEGSSASINGKTIASWPGLHKRDGGKRGEYGESIELEAGLHRVEYFHFEKNGDQEMNFCWKTGLDPATAKAPSTVPEKFFAHSARAVVDAGWHRDGRKLPLFTWTPTSYIWLTDKALCLYQCTIDGGLPPGTRHVWRIGDLESTEAELSWIVEGDGEKPIELAYQDSGRSLVSGCNLYLPATPRNASPNNPADRQAYRKGLYSRCLAAPAGRTPCASWTPDLWALLVATIEPYSGSALLNLVFEKSLADVQRIAAADRYLLEDVFYENLRYTSPSNVVGWLDKLSRGEADAARKATWERRRFHYYLYDVGNAEKAGQVVNAMKGGASTPVAQTLALVCAADLARMKGETDEAKQLYAEAANKRKGARPAAAPANPFGAQFDWRIGAVREAAYLQSVLTLIQQKAWLDAQRELDQWEQEFPMSKLSGDFLYGEAKYYYAIKDYPRTAAILGSYRAVIENATVMVEAMQMEVDCLMELKRPAEAAKVAAEMEKRFPGHPNVQFAVARVPDGELAKARAALKERKPYAPEKKSP